MPKFQETDHHVPRKIDKKKRHRSGFNEDNQESRQAKIGFKKYMQQLEEESLEYDLEEDDDL